MNGWSCLILHLWYIDFSHFCSGWQNLLFRVSNRNLQGLFQKCYQRLNLGPSAQKAATLPEFQPPPTDTKKRAYLPHLQDKCYQQQGTYQPNKSLQSKPKGSCMPFPVQAELLHSVCTAQNWEKDKARKNCLVNFTCLGTTDSSGSLRGTELHKTLFLDISCGRTCCSLPNHIKASTQRFSPKTRKSTATVSVQTEKLRTSKGIYPEG